MALHPSTLVLAGVSRWDTSGAQAVIEAYGGTLSKLSTFIAATADGTPVATCATAFSSYTYLKSPTNLDFESGSAALTPFNATDKKYGLLKT